MGYKVHLTETCDADHPDLITQVMTTPATTPDSVMGPPSNRTRPIVTLLGKSRWPISNTMGVRVTRDMGSVSLTFERCVSACFSARF